MKKAVLVEATLLYKIEESALVVCGYKISNPLASTASHLRVTSPEMIVEGYPYAVIPTDKYAKTIDTGFQLAQVDTLAKIDSHLNEITLKHAPQPSEYRDDNIANLSNSTPAFILCQNERSVIPPLNSPLQTKEENVSLTFIPIIHRQQIADKDLWLHRSDILKIFPSIISAEEPQMQWPWMNPRLVALNTACVSYYSSRPAGSTINVDELKSLILQELQKVHPKRISTTALHHCITALAMSKREANHVPTKEEKSRYHPLTAPSLVKINEISRILYDENKNCKNIGPKRSGYQRALSLASEKGWLLARSVKSLAPFMVPKSD